MKIRKHSGINQQSGKLKKGYKYSGKKLKSGLSQIIKTKKKTKRRKQKAGTKIGEGNFGCVVSPNLLCDTTDTNDNISKLLINPQDYEDEVQGILLLRDIDPTMKYILYPLKNCHINETVRNLNKYEAQVPNKVLCFNCGTKSVIKNNEDLTQCENDKGKQMNYNVIMKYGGNNLYKLNKNQKKIFINNFEHYFKYLEQGIKLLHKYNILHRDIKGDNIVLNNNGDIRFIDIGFIHKLEDRDFKDTITIFNNLFTARTIFYRPLDLDMIEYYIYDNSVEKIYYNNYEEFKTKWQAEDDTGRPTKYNESIISIFKTLYPNNVDKKIVELDNKLKPIFKKLFKKQNVLNEKFIRQYVMKRIKKWDLYSLKVTFYEQYLLNKINNPKIEKLIKPTLI